MRTAAAFLAAGTAGWRRPLFAPLLRRRWWVLGVLTAAGIHLGLILNHQHGLPCVLRDTVGISCPGCGLGTAMLLLVQGRWAEAMSRHALVPVFAAALLLMVIVHSLPEAPRARAVGWLERAESKSFFAPIFLATLLLYWFFRAG